MPGQRILIVEDEEAIVEVVSRTLRRHGYETASAADGDDALEKAFSLRPDLVILDLMLPKMTDGKSAGGSRRTGRPLPFPSSCSLPGEKSGTWWKGWK